MRGSCLLLLALLCLASLTACASGKTTVVLLQDPDGSVGAATISNEAGQQTLDQAGQSVTVADKTSAPGPVEVWKDDKIAETFGPALAAMPPLPAKFILYFRFDSAKLLDDSRAKIKEILVAVKERASTDISVNGHTDKTGDEAYNMTLSRKRVEAVKELLVEAGVAEEHLHCAHHGEGDPLVPTPDGVAEPRNRRVEVIVR